MTGPLDKIPVFFILQVFDSYWFWPGWSCFHASGDGNIDYEVMDIPQGKSLVIVVPHFTWPDTGQDTLYGLWFYGTLVSPDLTDILGDLAAVTWGYGPE